MEAASVPVLSLIAGLSAGWLLVLLGCGGGVRISDRRTLSENNVKAIGLAVHSYHDGHKSMPPGGIFDDQERGLHGWLTALLPYIDEQRLYDQIDLNAAWDDPRNTAVFQTSITYYQNPAVPRSRDERNFALSHYAGNSHVFARSLALSFRDDVPDGLSSTFMAGEAAGSYPPWGHPENWRDPVQGINQGPDTFGNPGGEFSWMLMMDGSVRRISNDIDPQVLKALSTPDGGEQVPLDF